MVEALPKFTEIKYVTSDGENCSATKKDGIVTVVGDKNGVRQIPEQEFLPEFVKDQAKKGNLERTPQQDQVNFKGNEEGEKEKEGSFGKAAASFFLPGLGQMLDGRTGDGLKQLGGVFGLGILSGGCTALAMNVKGKFGSYAALAGAVASGIGAFATGIYSIVDAYRGGKKS